MQGNHATLQGTSMVFSLSGASVRITPLSPDELEAMLRAKLPDPGVLQDPDTQLRLRSIISFRLEAENKGEHDLHFNPDQCRLYHSDEPKGILVTPLFFTFGRDLSVSESLDILANEFAGNNWTLPPGEKAEQILAFTMPGSRFQRSYELRIRELYFGPDAFTFSANLKQVKR